VRINPPYEADRGCQSKQNEQDQHDIAFSQFRLLHLKLRLRKINVATDRMTAM
jgi:hypothetical protein